MLVLSNSMNDTVEDAVLYYIGEHTNCRECLRGLSNDVAIANLPVSKLTDLKTRGLLSHLSVEMFFLFKSVENIFLKNTKSKDIFRDTPNECFDKF